MIFNSRFHNVRFPADEDPLQVHPDAERLWEIEILRRAREIDEGLVPLVPWNELRSRLTTIS
jgi:hypothetical protein